MNLKFNLIVLKSIRWFIFKLAKSYKSPLPSYSHQNYLVAKIVFSIEEMIDFLEKGIEKHSSFQISEQIKELQHFKDSYIGLWATDNEPENKELFFQLK